MKKKIIVIIISSIFLIAAIIGIAFRLKPEKETIPEEMIECIETALGPECKKQSMTEVIATLVYGDGTEDHKINYHILKTTYYEADSADVTGLHVDAFRVLFDPDAANSCQEMKIQDWNAALFETNGHSYLCWTYSPEVSYVLEYDPDAIADEEIIKMAQSATLYE